MGCCCAKPKPKEVPQERKPEPPAQKYVEPVVEVEEKVVVEERPKKAAPVVQAQPSKKHLTMSDLDNIPGSNKLNSKEKNNLFRALVILDSKDQEIVQVITVISFGFIINVRDKNDKITCVKVIFHDGELFPVNSEEESKAILTQELENIKRVHEQRVKDQTANETRVLKYKDHFMDNGKSIDNPTFKNMTKEMILFVYHEDRVDGTFQEFIDQNRGKLNDRSFLLAAQELIRGLNYLHSQRCVNRALTAEKILIDSEGKTIKYCDFRDAVRAQSSEKLRKLEIQKLEQFKQLQSPQVQYYLNKNTDLVENNDVAEIWVMGALLSQLGGVDQKKFDKFSSPDNNKEYVGDNQLAKAEFQKNALLDSLLAVQPNFQSKSSSKAPSNANQNQKQPFPNSDKLNEDSNDLLIEILEVDDLERKMFKIVGRIDFLAIKYHLNKIQPRHLPDYIKGKQTQQQIPKTDIPILEQATQNDPSNPKNFAKLASAIFQHQKDNTDKGIDAINRAIELDPNNGEYYNIQGSLYERALRIDEAEKSFKKAAEKEPNSSMPYHNLGYMYQKILQNNDEAIKFYEIAIQKNSNQESSIFNIALAYKDNNNFQESLRYYDKLVKLPQDKQDSKVYNNLGVLYMQHPELRGEQMAQETDPEYLFKRAVQLNPQDSLALVNLSEAQIKKDAGYEQHQQEINKNLQLAEQLSPSHAYTYYVKGLVEMVKSDANWDLAIDLFHRALRCHPSFSLAAYQIGLIQYEVKQNIGHAIEFYEKAIIFNSSNHYAFYSLALAQEENIRASVNHAEISKLKSKCLQNYRKAIQIKPDYVEAINNIAIFIKQIIIQERNSNTQSNEKRQYYTKVFEIVETYLKHAETIVPYNKTIADNLEELYKEMKQDDLANYSTIKGFMSNQ